MSQENLPAQPPTGVGLEGLRAAAAGCRACELWEPATQTVFGEGPETARVVFVGEQPGDQGAVWVALFEGRTASITGALRTAIPALRGALTPFPGHGGGWASWLLAIIAQCHGMLGEADEARAALAAVALEVDQPGAARHGAGGGVGRPREDLA